MTLFACANAPTLREQAALPAAPQYAPTLPPSPTPLPPDVTPTRAPPTIFPVSKGAELFVPKIHQTPISLAPIAKTAPKRNLAALRQYQRGIAYIATQRGEYASPQSQRALDELFATGANYVSLLVTWYQTDVASLAIARTENTPTDEELAFVIAYAHARGVQVLLKPQVDFSNDTEHWRGQIAFDNEADWQAWFASYQNFILHYARFAQAHGVEEFSVGTELVATTTRTADWRAVIRAVRKEYTGLLTYSANHSGEELQVRFWDDLDFIGVNVFYHLTNYRTPTLEQLDEGWELPIERLTTLHNEFPDKPIIFTEVGYPSMDLANVWPWDWLRHGAVDLNEQAMLYQALFQTWWHHPQREWFRGMFIWNWRTDPEQGGVDDIGYTPHGKPAEDILKYYYQMDSPPQHSTASE